MRGLSKDEYNASMSRILTAARVLGEEPFQDLLDTISAARSVGPVQYRTLELQARTIRAARNLAETFEEAKERGL